MANELSRKIIRLRKAQDAHEATFCPRCGANELDSELDFNAISRYADVYICDDCGGEEGMLEMLGDPMPMNEWDFFN